MTVPSFTPAHLNACHDDFIGNDGVGRYVFFPGSNGRAKAIAEDHFQNLKVKKHSRGHNLYLGTIVEGKDKLDVAAISSGMGTPSLDIIVNELVRLGVKRFLRVGTAGYLQPTYMKWGDFFIANGAIRDEGASKNYVPPEFPAIASADMVCAALKAAKVLGFEKRTHVGLTHSKDSLYAREFEEGAMAIQNKEYMDILKRAGVMASEMEASLLFVLTSLFNHKIIMDGKDPEKDLIKSGCICLLIGGKEGFGDPEAIKRNTEQMTLLCKQTIFELAKMEKVIA